MIQKEQSKAEKDYQSTYSELKKYFQTQSDNLIKYNDQTLTLEISLDAFHKLFEYIEIIGKNILGADSFIYRGVSNELYGLIPSIMRTEVFKSNPGKDEIDYLERVLIREFQKRARPYIDRLPRDSNWDWEWLALAQHHFLPTRLLDWTERPGTALFFAVEKKSLPEKENKDGCVWAILAPRHVKEQAGTKPETVEGVRLYRPPHIAPRIAMQQGCFTVHPGNYMSGPMDWIKGPKIKFIIRSENKERIRTGLYAAGVNRAALFPDLDGLAKHLKETADSYKLM